MQDVLAECQMLVAHISSMRDEAELIERSGPLNAETRCALLLKLIFSPRPATPHSEQEREHFSRAQKRNAQSAKRMRELRSKLERQRKQQEELHELDDTTGRT